MAFLVASLVLSASTAPSPQSLPKARKSAEVKLAIQMNGQPVGHATMSWVIDATGRLHRYIRSTMKVGEATREMRYESIVDKYGRSVLETEKDTYAGTKMQIVIATGAKYLTMTATLRGQTNSKKIPIPSGKLDDPSVFWFVTVKPKPGDSVKYLHYDFQNSKWEDQTSSYVGDEEVPGLKRKGHHVKQVGSDMWFDDQGLPLRTESTMENGIPMVSVRE